MTHAKLPRVLSIILCICMVLSILPLSALSAAAVSYDDTVDDYYSVISKQDWDLAPGITESEIILNNATGSQRQVLHVVEADVTNPYVKVMPSYAGMKEGLDNKDYKVQIMSEQTEWAEANGYGNIVASMNISLSWYTGAYYEEHPELIGEPLGYIVMDGQYYENSNGPTYGAKACVVINFDEKDGVARPLDMPKVQIRSTSDAITGWEEQVFPANFGFIIEDGKNLYKEDHNANSGAPRSFVGIKEDGTIITVMNDGRQAPYSTGLTSYEMGEVMLSLGCVVAANGDGGGSSTFLSQRPGEEMALHCSPSDGSQRPTTHGIFFITTAPATGEFVRANITTDNKYFTPGSTVEFKAVGTDLVGTEAEIPADATWQIKEDDMGTIENGVFVSNGNVGTATAQMVYNGEVVGECAVEIVIPEAFSFMQSTMTVPFGKEVAISLVATVDGGTHEVVLKESDVTFTLDNIALGTIDGFMFTAVDEENAPESLNGTITAKLNCADITVTSALSLGKGSEVIYDFENNIDGWNIGEVNKHDTYGEGKSYIRTIDQVDAESGMVHDGSKALHAHLDGTRGYGNGSNGVTQVGLYVDESVVISGAKSFGAWVYVPEDFYHGMIRFHYWYDSDANGTYDKRNSVIVLNSGDIYDKADEDGWYYFSTDISKYESIMIKGRDEAPLSTANSDASNYRFIEFMMPHLGTATWRDKGTINGPRDFYVDNITVDYSEAVEDREAPVFSSVTLSTITEAEYAMAKRAPVNTTDNVLNVVAAVAEDTKKTNATGLNVSSAKAYVDGVEVAVKYANGRLSISNIAVANGMHRVKFEICDNAGNKAVVIRLVNVQSGTSASTISVVPKDATLDRLYGGSVYWMDVNATDIETIQSVSAVIDINTLNHWELDHIELAQGFTATYTVDENTNTATVTITRTGENTQTGAVTLASLPIRVVSYERDLHIVDFDPVKYWNGDGYKFWPYDLKVDVDKGVITYVDGYTSDVQNTFSNEEWAVDSELYTGSLYMDSAFIAERGSCHVHTAEAVADKAATCTEAGYTGRTFCEVCDSVVDWGTTVPETGHNHEYADGQFVCSCGDVMTVGTGLFENNGKTYYAIGGKLVSGWQQIGEDLYYFDTKTFDGFDGIHSSKGICDSSKVFDYSFTDGKLDNGVWVEYDEGMRYYYGKTCRKRGNYEIDGKTYGFSTDGYRYEGFCVIKWSENTPRQLFEYTDDGVYVGERYDNGVFTVSDGSIYYLENGEAVYAGLVQDTDGSYYYFSGSTIKAVTNTTRYITNTNGLLPAGTYTFGADGKMVIELNGVVKDADGEIRYYENGVAVYAGLVKDTDGSYYYISGNTMTAVKNTTRYISKTNDLLPAGTYTFGADGKMVVKKEGIVTEPNGDIRYYENGVPVYAGLVQDTDGSYYYISGSTMTAVKDSTRYISKTNGLLPAGTYTFGADGKMIITKNGIFVEANGDIRYYENDVPVYAGLVQDTDGSYYYISGSTMKAVKNTTRYITKTNGLLPAGTYTFGADGKMIVKKDGVVFEANGDIRYYENGIAVYAGLVQDTDGSYYYISGSTMKAVKNTTRYITKTNDLLPAGTYTFGADGKMIVE